MGFKTPVASPALLEPVVSLLNTSRDALRGGDETNGRWVSGIEFQPYGNDQPWTADPCGSSALPNPADPQGVIGWTPYVVGVDDTCSALGFKGHEFKDRLDQKLKVGRHKAIELEFWGGAQAQASGWDNLWLTGTGVTDVTPGSGAPKIKDAMNYLEQALSDCGVGARGMIHIRPEALPYLTAVRREGNILLTPRDTYVVIGTGYPNTGPGGSDPGAADTWLFATGMVDVRVDMNNVNYFTLDPQGRATGSNFSDDEIIANMNRQTNLITTRAEVAALASWDGSCWFACKATLAS